MTERQQMFCREYLSDFDAVRAAGAAGYQDAGAAAARLLKSVSVQKELAKAVSRQNGAKGGGETADRGEILAFYTAVMRGAVSDTLIIQNKRKIQRTESDGSKVSDEETFIQTASVPPKLSELMGAADRLYKYYAGLGSDSDEAACGVVILPEIRSDSENRKEVTE